MRRLLLLLVGLAILVAGSAGLSAQTETPQSLLKKGRAVLSQTEGELQLPGLKEPVQVHLDGLFLDAEHGRQLLVPVTAGEQRQQLPLSGSESRRGESLVLREPQEPRPGAVSPRAPAKGLVSTAT